ncbi:MAG: hypothetical protein JWP31_1987 [Aeromicrobium sp.]|nr:hypothetical protein [Aeromicrobium sp.]
MSTTRTFRCYVVRVPNEPAARDDTGIRAFMQRSLQRHAIELGEWMMLTSLERSHARGHTALRPAHARLFVDLDWDGSRMSDIARAQGVSKNAIGHLAAELEALGYVERVPDPRDGRAKILRYTELGRSMMTDAREIGEQIDAEVAALIGADRYAELRDILADLTARIAPAARG